MHLLAPLTNISGHVLALNFGHPFLVQRWSLWKLVRLLVELEGLPENEIIYRLDYSRTVREKRNSIERSQQVYVVVASKYFEANEITDLHKRTEKISQKLESYMKVARLFYSGSMGLQGIYWYSYGVGDFDGLLSSTINDHQAPRATSDLTSWSVKRLNDVLHSVELPFKHAYLNLATEHFNSAERFNSVHMEFIALMIGLEVIFNAGPQDLRYRIARSIAVLLGEDKDESTRYFDWAKKLYDARSKLVHTGVTREINDDHLWRARLLLKRSIVAAYQSGLDKSSLLENLNSCGFGGWPKREWYYVPR